MSLQERSHTISGEEILSEACGRRVPCLVMERLMRSLQYGRITVVTPAGERYERRGEPGPHAVLVLHNWRPMLRMLLGGDIGFAKSYMDGDWSTPDLASLIELGAVNSDSWGKRVSAWMPLRALNRLRHWRRANTKRGSRNNIEFHYDLGNDFYTAWLDRSMTYSSALFAQPRQALEEAQDEKLGLILRSLELQGGENVLEIGCGWGGLAEKLIVDKNCTVTGLTLSPSQLAYAQERLSRAGVSTRADLRLEDYRDTSGEFDRIVSVEMLEAVGLEFWPAYFATVFQRLKPGGIAALQVITIDDARFDSYRKEVDFIQRYVFPGGMLPSDAVLKQQIAASGLKLKSVRRFGESYARTLGEWNRRFQAAWPQLETQGFDLRFKRLWEYYLAYCEAGFRAGTINVGLYVLERPLSGSGTGSS